MYESYFYLTQLIFMLVNNILQMDILFSTILEHSFRFLNLHKSIHLSCFISFKLIIPEPFFPCMN